MNQILVTEKVYVTPELKRKKKVYKGLFMISSFCLVCLTSICIYAAYDRNKESEISNEIVENMFADRTVISQEENALVVKITQDFTENAIEHPEEEEIEEEETTNVQQSSVYTASDGTQYNYIGRIVIPKIDVDYAIFDHWTYDLLKKSICKFHGGEPNEDGNLCLIGHNWRNKRFFSKVPTLENGDIVQITDLSGRTVEYEVYDKHQVDPNDVSDTTQEVEGREVTLITCTDDSKHRVVVRCREKK